MRRLALPLWVRLALVMAVLPVVLVVLVGYSAIRIATGGAETSSQLKLQKEAELEAELVGRWVHDQAPLLLTVPKMYRSRMRDLSPEGLAAFPTVVLGVMPSARAVALVDGDGVPVVPPATVGEDVVVDGVAVRRDIDIRPLLDRLPLTAAIEDPDGKVLMGDPWLADGRPSLPMAVRVSAGVDASDTWVLAVQVALEPVDQLAPSVSETHAVALFDGAGKPLFGGDHRLLDVDRLKPLLGTDADFILESPSGEVRGVVKPVTYWAPSWSLVVAEPADVVLAPASEIRGLMVPQLAGATLAALVLAAIVASSLSRPVVRLRDAANKVADGRPGVRANIRRSDEIGELARAFDHMAVRLDSNRGEIAAQQAEIEAFNRELQARVDERTAELRDAQESLVVSGQLAAVAELGAGLAHELNNPLAAVLGLAQVLRTRHPDDPLLADLEHEAARCREVVQTMRRMQSLEVDPTDAPVVQLAEVLHQILGLVGGSFRQRGVLLELVPVSPELWARIDPVHGSRILAQILNALRAGLEPGATVRIGAERVADADIPEVMVRLMPDRPVGSHPDRRDDWMASGHGLWVARQLLDRLGGRMEVVGRSGVQEWRVLLPGAPRAEGSA